jgi:hypothetical protein
MKSVMTHDFSKIPKAEIQRSSFDRSHGYKTTMNAGELIPFFVDECVPGDSFRLSTNAFARLATPIKPIMDNMMITTFFFAVPYRLVWDHFKRFMGEQPHSPTESIDFTVPQVVMPAAGAITGSLADYMGIPVGVPNLSVSALHFRAYNLIWNEWFRSEVLQTAVNLDTGDGPDVYADYNIKRRTKRPDYFTSCLPWPQKQEEVLLPLGVSAVVKTINGINVTGAQAPLSVGAFDGSTITGARSLMIDGNAKGAFATGFGSEVVDKNFYPNNLIADLSGATAATINDLREAFQLQRLSERDARGGTRYTELVRSHFGILSDDGRQQRPELLSTHTSPVNIHPVAQNSPTGTYANTPQGNLAGFGTASFSGHGFSKSFTEHTLIIGLICVHADLNYQNGLNRMWSRKTRYDFYFPALAHLGEQAVLNKEIFAAGTSADDLVFGYQERWAEMKYKPSIVCGKFNSNETGGTPLDVWHLAQDFTGLPALASSFIEENPPIDRIIATPTEPHFLLDVFFNLKCARPMPLYSVPGMIDHF